VLRMPLAVGTFQPLVRRPWGRLACVRGQDATALLGDESLSDHERGGQGPVDVVDDRVGVGAWPKSSPCASAGRRAPRAGVQAGDLPALLTSRKRLWRLRCARQGRAAEVLPGLDCLITGLTPRLVHRPLGLRLAGLGVQEGPAWLDPAITRRQCVIAIALYQRRHRLRIGLG
jgi:hypothetical protein